MTHTGDGLSYQILLQGSAYSLSPPAAAIYADSLDGVLEGSSVSPTGSIQFDGRGLPSCSAGLSCASSSQTILISASGDGVSLTLEPYTGYVRR